MILIGLCDPYDSGCLTHIVTIIYFNAMLSNKSNRDSVN